MLPQTTSVTTVYIATATNTATENVVSTVSLGWIRSEASILTSLQLTIPGVILAIFTAIIGLLSGASRDVDDEFYELDLPFAIGAYGDYNTKVFLSTNGMITLGSGTAIYENNVLGFLNQYLPSVTIAGLFDDLYIY